ncbi:DUF1697 domain-containing protein [Dyadobacter sp. 32]|uniref:DUF1697 domain-containing protein n=1 Tax=Dyadobacter sp. 32 TaxID=538966 RepID=UPI0039C607E9
MERIPIMSEKITSTYVAVLRGINVSGKNMIKMPALVKSFESLEFEAVRSYIQSGNLVFDAPTAESAVLAKRIHDQIIEDFGFDIPVLVMGIGELVHIRDANPYIQRPEIDPAALHVTFLENIPDEELVAGIDPVKYHPDEFIVIGKSVYLHCPVGYGTTKLNNNFFENKLKTKATTRNWKTVNKLVELVEN